MADIHKVAEPFFFPGDSTGILLIHGFTGSPSEVRWLGEKLNRAGYTVTGCLLAGHGTTVEDMAGTCWRDWYFSAEKCLLELRRKCDTIFIIGLSMGGLLSLYLSMFHKVKGVVALNAPIYLVNKQTIFVPLLHHIKRFTGKPYRNKVIQAASEEKTFAYDRIPLKALYSLREFIKLLCKELPEVVVPTMVIQSSQDRVVEPRSARYIFDKIASPEKTLHWFENSGHLITLEDQRETLLNLVLEFLEEQVNKAAASEE